MRFGAIARFWTGIVSLFALNLGFWLVVWIAVASFGFGLSPTAVPTASMMPTVQPGDLVMLKHSDGEGLGKGTVIRFKRPGDGMAVLHRIEQAQKDGSYITKGDNNSNADQPVVQPSVITGVGVLLVPMAGMWFLEREKHPQLVIPTTLLLTICLLVGAMQALDPENDPWLDSNMVSRRSAARITAAGSINASNDSHLIEPIRLEMLRHEVAESVSRLTHGPDALPAAEPVPVLSSAGPI